MKHVILVLCVIVLSIVSYSWRSSGQTVNQKNVSIVAGEASDVEHWVVESDWDGVMCKRYDVDDGYTQKQECVFPNANLKQVYDIVKKSDENLIADLPLKDIKYTSSQDESITVNFNYKLDKHLYIRVSYDGGVTSVEIIEYDDNTISKITFSFD